MSFLGPISAGFAVTPDTVPTSDAELLECLKSWEWRICSGQLYMITTKGDTAEDEDMAEDEDLGVAVPFKPNRAQRRFIRSLHRRNIILKARQLGFSTLIDIMALDHALFNRDQEVVVIAHTQPAATKLYRKKVCFAYDNMPAFVRALVPTVERSQTQMVFANGSSIEVSSSARGGTPHFLHISEFGKIAAKFPQRAEEITTGALQGVPLSGIVFIESTAEGRSGAFYVMSNRSQALFEKKAKLGPKDYRFHFYPWWEEPGYALDPKTVIISAKDHEYFDAIEDYWDQRGVICAISLPQRAWYVSTRDNEFPDAALMWREYPSTPEEAWQASTAGFYYAKVLSKARREGRIGRFPMHMHIPVNSFWDLGVSDSTCIWLHQRLDTRDLWIGFYEDNDSGYLPAIRWMEDTGYIWGSHYLPHDGKSRTKGEYEPTSPISVLRKMRPAWDFRIVPRALNVQHAIDAVRLDFGAYYFNEAGPGIKEGLFHLENYQREFNQTLQAWGNAPLHDEHSHAADAFRQKAQGYLPGSATKPSKKPRASGLTA